MTPTWTDLLSDEKQKDYFQQVVAFVDEQRQQGKTIYPPQENVFAALQLTAFADVKVVIIGQDPYHGPNQANGLAFSVNPGIRLPPSLRNIYKEIESDLDLIMPTNGDLSHWAKQGVLLLNTVLTVEASQAHSHKDKGWETFTDRVIASLNDAPQHIVYLLWGAHAQKKSAMIDKNKHTIFKAPHPSPLSAHRGFFGCKHFSKANQALQSHGQPAIDWLIRD